MCTYQHGGLSQFGAHVVEVELVAVCDEANSDGALLLALFAGQVVQDSGDVRGQSLKEEVLVHFMEKFRFANVQLLLL